MALSATAEQIGRPAVLIVFGWLLMQLDPAHPHAAT
jgi:hypothetical protein